MPIAVVDVLVLYWIEVHPSNRIFYWLRYISKATYIAKYHNIWDVKIFYDLLSCRTESVTSQGNALTLLAAPDGVDDVVRVAGACVGPVSEVSVVRADDVEWVKKAPSLPRLVDEGRLDLGRVLVMAIALVWAAQGELVMGPLSSMLEYPRGSMLEIWSRQELK